MGFYFHPCVLAQAKLVCFISASLSLCSHMLVFQYSQISNKSAFMYTFFHVSQQKDYEILTLMWPVNLSSRAIFQAACSAVVKS